MKLYFLRHAEALDGADDAKRPLSNRGNKQAREMGRFLQKAGVAFDAAYSSPLVRARETAEIVLEVCGRVPVGKLLIVEELLNELSPAQFVRWLRGLPGASHVLLVGHAPSLSEHLSAILGVPDPNVLKLPKGGLACVRLNSGQRPSLKLFISPKTLGV